IQSGCTVIWFLPFLYLWATGWRMPVDAMYQHQCHEIVIAYLGVLVLIHLGLQVLTGPDADVVRHNWHSGEAIIGGYSLREWGLIAIPCLTGFVLAFLVPKGMKLVGLSLSAWFMLIGFALGICAGYWKKLQRNLEEHSKINANLPKNP